MRIAIVSAHYPPNFVSGGTLQPQRLARAFRQRNHDVFVYAGHLDASRPDLSTWTEDDGHGVQVRWITTARAIGWSDDVNWHNPGVSADFDSWLHEVRPDVVHLHSLQSLGGSLVAAARSFGAATVVTMHDFWWCCARQFLVDRTFTPCCLVVDAGVCPCEIDHDWAASRAERLREWLGSADLVLAPSEIAAKVLTANGINALVDENGIPPQECNPRSAETRANTTGLRFTYAGGPLEMKGVHVVLDALRLVAQEVGSEDWRVVAYGASQYVADHGLDTTGLPIELAPAFAPHELADILSRTDVLILPSVMRETHSLLTREALIAGVPVVATDSLGPEEVVADGLNGLIVPSGSATGLADAMQRLVTDPALVARLRAGVLERPVTVRALDDQVEGLERRFVELTRREPQPNDRQPATSSIGHVTFMVGIDGAPLRYRARLPAEALGLLGVGSDVRHYRDDALPAIVETTDALVVYRVPATVQTLALIDAARERGIPVIFDVDDLIFDPEIADEIPALRLLPKDDADLWLEGVRRYRTTMEHCDGYIGSTAMLVDHARAVVGLPARRFDNGVGLLLARRSDIAIRTPRSAGPLRIGYFSGTTTHDDDWRFVEPAIADTLKKRDDVELWLGGHLNPGDDIVRLGARVRRLPFMHWTDLPAVLRDLDINLAPLEPHSRFNDAKSAIKWLEAALCSTPTIASSTEPFREAIDHEVNGVLATTLDDWRDAVDRLLDDNLLRDGIGSRARRDALLNWSPHVQARRYRAILEEARQWSDESRPERPESMAWTPVVHDEPLMPVALEPYGDALPDVAGVPEPPSRPGLVRRFVRSLGEDGVKVTARRVATRLRRWHHD